MENMKPVQRVIRDMESICLHPHLSAGLSIHNKKTGEFSGPKSITLSFGISLFKMLMLLAGILLFWKGAMCFCRWKREQKIRNKYRAKLRRLRKK